jgi:hypothetical protein
MLLGILEECTEFVTVAFSGSGAFSFSTDGEQETVDEIMKTDGTVVAFQFSFAVGYGDDFLFR